MANLNTVVYDIWDSMAGYLNASDLGEAADTFVSLLVDAHEVDPNELVELFDGYDEILRALHPYCDHDHSIEEDESYLLDEFEDFED